MAGPDSQIAKLRKALEGNPGDNQFVELALLLSNDPETRTEAREVCFRGLAENPNNYRGRLILSKLFYLDHLGEFCVRELIELSRRVQTPALSRLLDAFGEFAKPFRSGLDARPGGNVSHEGSAVTSVTPMVNADAELVAEVDFDEDFIEILNELEEEE